MKKIARNKLNAIFKKSGFLTIEKISRIFKTDFLTIIHTLTPKFVQHFCSENRYTFLSISLHFPYHLSPSLNTLNEQQFLAKRSFVHKLRFHRALLYRETSYPLSFIQLSKIDKAISVAKHLQFAQKAVIMNKNQRLVHCVPMNKNHRLEELL